ncbi:MAG TPA: hypothetical protein VGQ27_10645 [Steroidobacteraceae bacterium]|jgi:hypothetical protein|nr:hypothetical protein [Steroidobacteraceae bacterium]
MKTKLIGLALIAAGIYLAYAQFYQPWTAVSAGADTITTSTKAVFAIPLAIGMGFIYLLGSPTFVAKFPYDRMPSGIGIAVAVVLIGAGIGMDYLLDQKVKDAGYVQTSGQKHAETAPAPAN